MKVLFDLNVILDLFLDRAPWSTDAKILTAHVLAGRIQGYVCATAVPTLFYVARKTVGADQALVTVERCLRAFDVLAIGRLVLEEATRMAGSDYEDNIHIAAAVEAGMDVIVTRDPAGFSGAPLAVSSPAGLVTQLSQVPPAAP